MGFLDLLLGNRPSLPISYAADSSSIDIVRLTDGVYDLLYHSPMRSGATATARTPAAPGSTDRWTFWALTPPNTSA